VGIFAIRAVDTTSRTPKPLWLDVAVVLDDPFAQELVDAANEYEQRVRFGTMFPYAFTTGAHIAPVLIDGGRMKPEHPQCPWCKKTIIYFYTMESIHTRYDHQWIFADRAFFQCAPLLGDTVPDSLTYHCGQCDQELPQQIVAWIEQQQVEEEPE